jgi:hypothetical protein
MMSMVRVTIKLKNAVDEELTIKFACNSKCSAIISEVLFPYLPKTYLDSATSESLIDG